MSKPKQIGVDEPWEKILGKNCQDRTQVLGRDNSEYRQQVHLPPIDKDALERHTTYIHELGADALRTQMEESKEIEQLKLAIQKKVNKNGKLLRRKIRVIDLEDGGVSISIDQEWDTSTWSDELIEAGCEALILIFYDPSYTCSQERKERAVTMLQKLIQRHKVAETYVRKNVEMMVGKAVSKLIRGGRCGGLLDLLYVLNSCKHNFIIELSHYNFNGKALDMLNQEARLATILIQHTYRSKHYKNKFQSNYIPKIEGFGSENEIKMSRLGVINARSAELRAKWRNMHWIIPEKIRKMNGGERGPIHIGAKHTELVLDIVLYLLSEHATKLCHGNREDIVKSNGCILLSTFLAYPVGRFCAPAAHILANISYIAESLLPIVQTGCITCVIKIMRYLRTVGVGNEVIKEKRTVKFPIMEFYFRTLDILINTAVHAAGFYRASQGYDYVTNAHDVVETINYKQLLLRYEHTKQPLVRDIVTHLGSVKLLQELSAMTINTNKSSVMNKLLCLWLTLLGTEVHNMVVAEFVALNGVLLLRITELLQVTNHTTSTYAMCVLLQLCTTIATRNSMYSVHITPELVKMNKTKNPTEAWVKLSYQRNLLISVALCRQSDWRLYNPVTLPIAYLHDISEIRKQLYLDLLKTIKNPAVEVATTLTIADLIVLPTNQDTSLALSKSILQFDPKYVTDFLYHPDDENYYESLQLEEAVANCVILSAIALHEDTARAIFCKGLVRYIGKMLYLCKFIFLGKPMRDAQIMVLLHGVQACAMTMGRLSLVCIDKLAMAEELISTIQQVELLLSAFFFLNTLSISHPKLDESTHELQKIVGLACLSFFKDYATLLLYLEGKSKIAKVEDIYGVGANIVQMILYLKKVHGKTSALVLIFDYLCQLLHRMTTPVSGAYVALEEWKIIESLNIYLPSPLSGLIDEHAAMILFAPIVGAYPGVVPEIPYYDDSPDYGAAGGSAGSGAGAGGGMNTARSLISTSRSRTPHTPSQINNNNNTLNTSRSMINTARSHQSYNSSNYEQGSIFNGSVATTDQYESEEATKISEMPSTAMDHSALVGYQLGLIQLPASFFELLANLCQIDTGKYHCLHEGFLRRALDKLMILYATFLHIRPYHTSTYNRKTRKHEYPVVNHRNKAGWLKLKAEIIACLRLITKCANYHHGKTGSTNDLIFLSIYRVVEVCKAIILFKDFKRDDEIIIIAYETLAALAHDTYRVSKYIEMHDIFGLIQKELSAKEETFPLRGGKAATDILHHATTGLTSDYIVKMIPLLREPMSKLARIFPELGQNVLDANWSMTKSAMIYRNTVDPTLHIDADAELCLQIEEFIRTGTATSTNSQQKHFTFSFSGSSGGGETPKEGERRVSSASGGGRSKGQTTDGFNHKHTKMDTIAESIKEVVATVAENSATGHEVLPDEPGTYFHCGVSSCGSLRIPCKHYNNAHGTHAAMNEKEAEDALLKLHFSDPNICAISQLSARESELRDILETRKSQHGFIEKKKYNTINTYGKNTVSMKRQHNNSNSSPVRKDIDGGGIGNGNGGKGSDNMNSKLMNDVEITMTNTRKNANTTVLSPLRTHSPSVEKQKMIRLENANFTSPIRRLNSPPLKMNKTMDADNVAQKNKLITISTTDLPQLLMTRPPPPK